MRADIEYLELRIQELEEENLQLKGELDERPTPKSPGAGICHAGLV